MDKYIIKDKVEIFQTDCLHFLKSLNDNSVDAIVTDPAYSGMNNRLNFGNGRIVGEYQKEDNGKWFKEFKDDPKVFMHFLKECNRVMKDNRHIYIMFDNYSLLSLAPLMREVFNVKNIIVWDKVNIGMGHYFRRRHELIVFATKGYRKLSSKSLPDIWSVKRIHKAFYPTQKPVAIFDYMLKGSVSKDYIVCDPFVGSGSAIISALKYKCKFIGSDISEKACKTSLKRAAKFIDTGRDIFDKQTRDLCYDQQA